VPQDPPSVEERLRSLVLRELGAEEVSVGSPGEGAFAPDDPCWLTADLPDERVVAARFAEPPSDRGALSRRMQILVSAFSYLLGREGATRSRAPVAQSLKGELSALAARAQASDAFVIDAHSPVVWGSARGFRQTEKLTEELAEAMRLLDLSRRELEALLSGELASDPPPPRGEEGEPTDQRSRPPPDSSSFALDERAVAALRALPEFTELKRGHPLTHRHREPDFGYAAHSFAGIYLLVLVFEGVFDELRAERAVQESIARIERLVLALPPLDPGPTAGANVIRFRRRR
jgi:hypothetical protein